MYTPVARQISSFGCVARQPNQLAGILKSPYESLDPANAYFINFIHQQEVYFAWKYGFYVVARQQHINTELSFVNKMFFFSADNYIGLCYFPSVPQFSFERKRCLLRCAIMLSLKLCYFVCC